MSDLTRRRILSFFGVSAAVTALDPPLARLARGGRAGLAEAAGLARFTPIRLPHPLPVYTEEPSWLPTGPGAGTLLPSTPNPALASYDVIDDVVVPPGFEYYVILAWGDRVFPDRDDYVGYNCDYTAFVPLSLFDKSDGLLWVNHEYVSFPFATLAPGTPADLVSPPGATSFQAVIGFPFPATVTRESLGEMHYNMGGSVVRVRTDRRGRYQVVPGYVRNRRVHGLSGLAINAGRTDGYGGVTSWGTRAHQLGDDDYLVGSGPAAAQVFPLSSDGLGNRIIGTGFNCSGATTPWGTVLSAEENFQGSSLFFIGVQEAVKKDGTQTGYLDGTSGKEFGLVGEKYGWLVEIDLEGRQRGCKHTALGRFRHENAAFRAEWFRPLVVYMGDDRRGGHIWKYVSDGLYRPLLGKANRALLESGTLHVAHLNADGTGRWIPLTLTTPTNPQSPTDISSVEFANLGVRTNNGRIPLPRRPGIASQTIDGGAFNLDVTNEATARSQYQGKTLADFYATRGAMLCDAFLAGNLVGGTPAARPEDIEVNPRRQREVFISLTDGAPGSDGYPDSRIFVVAKYSAALNATQHSGTLLKIVEDSADSIGQTFRWERFVNGGEAGAAEGDGFGAVDNLAFDDRGNIWGVTDMSTNLHNGFNVGAAGTPVTIDHAQTGSGAPANLVGVFGDNWMFCVPVDGPDAGQIRPFAYGPPRCEMTGPTFVDDTLIISVQHPSEDSPYTPAATLARDIQMLALDGTAFVQHRTVPRGSNWPAGNGAPPRPATIGIHAVRRLFGGSSHDGGDQPHRA